MSEPKDKSLEAQPSADTEIETSEQGVITNNEESNKIVNTDDAVAELDGIENTLREDEPSTALNADRDVTNSEQTNGDEPVVN